MALQRCPDCCTKISQSAQICPHCSFQFDQASLDKLRMLQQQRYQQNQEINRQSTKIQLIWLIIFALVIGITACWIN